MGTPASAARGGVSVPLFQHRLEGQNLLVCPTAIDDLIRLVAPTRQETILEIGAGAGNITLPLAEQCGHLIAVEKDALLYLQLVERCQGRPTIQPVFADFFQTHELWWPAFPQFPAVDKFVANLPFGYVEAVLARLAFVRFRSFVAILGERQVARVRSCFPGLAATFVFERKQALGDEAFHPPPSMLARHKSASDVHLYVITLAEASAPG
jgi:16S rRNA A1518/A1519 N6-dimethyltransferase RsmA/KsgA/DIM1 with predicted DNA glycosylase/AP lyase activity